MLGMVKDSLGYGCVILVGLKTQGLESYARDYEVFLGICLTILLMGLAIRN